MASKDGAAAPLYGLVLAGGESRRMQRDKAALEFGGKTQLQRAYELLEPFCQCCYVSTRLEQADDAARRPYPQIHDQTAALGPVGGILAAQATHPEAAWLVIACDLPLLDAATLTHLIAHRTHTGLVTAYRSSYDGLPEPLCAIYEPASRAPIRRFVDDGLLCPRKMLSMLDAALIAQPDPKALDNINRPEELEQVQRHLRERS